MQVNERITMQRSKRHPEMFVISVTNISDGREWPVALTLEEIKLLRDAAEHLMAQGRK